jgi:hypothetical protein
MIWNANGALAEILARDMANGVDVFDDGGVPRPVPGPPLQLEPLRRPVFPEPDWRAEERAAVERDAAPDPGPPPESLDSRPAKPRKKPVPTPNLDKVRAWLQEDGR